MRAVPAFLLIVASIPGLSCGGGALDPPPPRTWATGFWFWDGSSPAIVTEAAPLDVLFFQAGNIRRGPLGAFGDLPPALPPAREYWLVFRSDEPAVPSSQAAPDLAHVFAELKQRALDRKLPVAGIQLDIDSPTAALPQYAAFVRALRQALGPGVQISITALLDWFRSGAAVGEVIREADEFVPQFYDLQERDSRTAIAARFDAAKWGPVFNRYRKRFRIGISTFGRARLVQREGEALNKYVGLRVLSDLKQIDIAVNPAFSLYPSRTEANELLLTYRVNRKTSVGYSDFEPGDAIEFILSTPETVKAGVEQARLIRGYCAGVVFFRWPAFNEALTTQPDEVLAAAGVTTNQGNKPGSLRTMDGACATVACTDLYLLNSHTVSAQPIRYRIVSSTELEYFLPKERMPARMSGPSEIEVSLPPYCGHGRMYLGRAVTAKRGQFNIEESR